MSTNDKISLADVEVTVGCQPGGELAAQDVAKRELVLNLCKTGIISTGTREHPAIAGMREAYARFNNPEFTYIQPGEQVKLLYSVAKDPTKAGTPEAEHEERTCECTVICLLLMEAGKGMPPAARYHLRTNAAIYTNETVAQMCAGAGTDKGGIDDKGVGFIYGVSSNFIVRL